MDKSVLLDDGAFLENGQIGDAYRQGRLANNQTETAAYHHSVGVQMPVEGALRQLHGPRMHPLRRRRNSDLAVYHFFRCIADFGHAEPLFIGDGCYYAPHSSELLLSVCQ